MRYEDENHTDLRKIPDDIKSINARTDENLQRGINNRSL